MTLTKSYLEATRLCNNTEGAVWLLLHAITLTMWFKAFDMYLISSYFWDWTFKAPPLKYQLYLLQYATLTSMTVCMSLIYTFSVSTNSRYTLFLLLITASLLSPSVYSSVTLAIVLARYRLASGLSRAAGDVMERGSELFPFTISISLCVGRASVVLHTLLDMYRSYRL